MKKAYVVGAGLAGLSAATVLAARGVAVTVLEGAPHAGGRCRSYFDPGFGGIIDNGNHLVLSGNRAVHDYLARIGAKDALTGPDACEFPFVDLENGERWVLRPNDGRLPYWVARKTLRVPGTAGLDYANYAPLLWANKNARIGDVVRERGPLWRRLMHPFLLAALNTEPEISSARLAGRVIQETLMKGGRFFRPRIAHPTLAAAFIDPALAYLNAKGTALRLSTRLRGLAQGAGRVTALTAGDAIAIAPGDAVVLAVPPWATAELLPGLIVPDDFRAIVNAHFKIAAPAGAPAMLGVIGGTAEWIFSFSDRISVTVSGADAIVDRDREELARTIWADVTRAPRYRSSHAPMADRQGKARHLCRHAGAGRQASAVENATVEPVFGRRLDQDRLARHHRRRPAVGRNRGGFGAAASVSIVLP